MLRSLRQPARLLRLLILAAIAVSLYITLKAPHLLTGERAYDVFPSRRLVDEGNPSLDPLQLQNASLSTSSNRVLSHCSHLPPHLFSSKIQVVLKTGAGEVFDKLLVHLETVTSCVPPSDILIFSDLAEQIGPYIIHDALDTLPEEVRSSPDFDIYHQQHEHRRNGQDVKDLKGGWVLDKYKFLPMMEKSWVLRPGKEWYIFLEADTYVLWDNLMEFLSHLDPEKELYLGSPVWPKDRAIFAHGGSGIVLSRAAMAKLNRDRMAAENAGLDIALVDMVWKPGNHQFGLNVSDWCCGDQVLAQVLKDRGIKLRGYWPMFNGEKPATVPYGKEHWCHPVLTLHHIVNEELNALWQWEQRWRAASGNLRALLFYDLITYQKDILNASRTDWDNLSGEARKLPAESFEECQEVCTADKHCLQFLYHNGKCGLSNWIRFGARRVVGDGKEERMRYKSGWVLPKIQKWVDEHECTEVKWVKSNP